jgi:hypothetical protein
MYKYIILLILFLSTVQINSFAQNSNDQGFWSNTRVGLSGTYDMSYKSAGFIAKGEKAVFNIDHFNGYAGVAFRFGRLNETDLLMDSGIEGGSSDMGLFATFSLDYYPFKRKRLYFGLESFVGLTNLKASGTLELPAYDISERYSNSYTYINYGLTPSIGYSFGKISTSLFALVSLKGALDHGRFRLGDPDSRILFGVNISYKLNVLE